MIVLFWVFHLISYFIATQLHRHYLPGRWWGHSDIRTFLFKVAIACLCYVAIDYLILLPLGWHLRGTYSDWTVYFLCFLAFDLYFIGDVAKRDNLPWYRNPWRVYTLVRKAYVYTVCFRIFIIIPVIYSGYRQSKELNWLSPVMTIPKEDGQNRTADIPVFDNLLINEMTTQYIGEDCLFRVYVKRLFIFKKLVIRTNLCMAYRPYIETITPDSLTIGEGTSTRVYLSVKRHNVYYDVYGYDGYGEELFVFRNIR